MEFGLTMSNLKHTIVLFNQHINVALVEFNVGTLIATLKWQGALYIMMVVLEVTPGSKRKTRSSNASRYSR